MKKFFVIALSAVLALTLLAGCGASSGGQTETTAEDNLEYASTKLPYTEGKNRLIITQDGEVDDKNSMLHALLYLNDVDLEGIVQTSSMFHSSGDDTTEAERWPGTDWMYQYVDAYAEVYPNLVVQDPDYPTPDYVRSVTVIGNVSTMNDTSVDTDGSNLIKASILKDDDRPLYIEIGGGANSVARALMSIEEEYKDTAEWESIQSKINENLLLFSWGSQDDTYADYIQVNWPEIRYTDASQAATGCGYAWGSADGLTDEAKTMMSGAWMKENLLDKGAILSLYNSWGDGKYYEGEDDSSQYGMATEYKMGNNVYDQYSFLSEGDNPAWIVALNNGLRANEDLSYGGWAGRFVAEGEPEGSGIRNYVQAEDEPGIAIFMDAIMKDFATRADWCTASTYEEANHLPTVTVAEGLDLTGAAGDTITITASAVDPDGDTTTFDFWQWEEADTYAGTVELTVKDGTCSFTIPEDAKSGDTIHIVVEGIDGGGYNPIAYQRVIVTVK